MKAFLLLVVFLGNIATIPYTSPQCTTDTECEAMFGPEDDEIIEVLSI